MAAQGLPESGVALQGVGYVFEGVDGGGRWGAGMGQAAVGNYDLGGAPAGSKVRS